MDLSKRMRDIFGQNAVLVRRRWQLFPPRQTIINNLLIKLPPLVKINGIINLQFIINYIIIWPEFRIRHQNLISHKDAVLVLEINLAIYPHVL